MNPLHLLALLLCSLAPLLHAQSGLTRLGEFRVNTTTTSGDQGNTSVATDGHGNFVVVWRSTGSGNVATDGIFAQRYDRGGSPIGGQITVDNSGSVYLAGATPAVACADDGSFAVVYEVTALGGTLIAIKRFDANDQGAPRDLRSAESSGRSR